MLQAAGVYSKGLGKSKSKEFTNDVEVTQGVLFCFVYVLIAETLQFQVLISA